MATNPNSAPAPKIPHSLLLDLEMPILEIGNIQRIAEIVLQTVLDSKHPALPKQEGMTFLAVNNDDAEALQQALILASKAGANLKGAWLAANDRWKALNATAGNSSK